MKGLNARGYHLEVQVVTDLVSCRELHHRALVMRYRVRYMPFVPYTSIRLLLLVEQVAV